MNPELTLRDIHLPDPVSGWPPAVGWWYLLTLILFSVLLVWVWRRYKTRRRLQTQALAELKQIEITFDQYQDQQQLAKEISMLLRRICISHFPHSDVAGLNGDAWLTFLNNQTNAFNAETAQILQEAPYRKNYTFDSHKLISACRIWIEKLHPAKVTNK